MTSKMSADDRRREWAKLAVDASVLTGDQLPPEVYARAQEGQERGAGARPRARNGITRYARSGKAQRMR